MFGVVETAGLLGFIGLIMFLGVFVFMFVFSDGLIFRCLFGDICYLGLLVVFGNVCG